MKNENQFTPGPWKVMTYRVSGLPDHVIQTEDAFHPQLSIAHVGKHHNGIPCEASEVERFQISRANANLMAAAPELLEALESALKNAEFETQAWRPWRDKARAAISKAKGLR